MVIFDVVIEPSALLDIHEARRYYRALSPEIVNELNAEMAVANRQIEKYPFAYNIRRDGNRRYNLKQFRYAVYNIADDASQPIDVHAFVPTSRNYPAAPEQLSDRNES